MVTINCARCDNLGDAITFRCYDCLAIQHIHHPKWKETDPLTVAVIECPQCGVVNAIKKPSPHVITGFRYVRIPVQAEMPV